MLTDRTLRQQIEAILAEHPHCRDDDQRLMCNVWRLEFIAKYGQEKYSNTAFHDGLGTVARGVLSKPESIRRTRQKIQELQPLLRGENYRERQRHQSQVKKEVRQFR